MTSASTLLAGLQTKLIPTFWILTTAKTPVRVRLLAVLPVATVNTSTAQHQEFVSILASSVMDTNTAETVVMRLLMFVDRTAAA